MKIKIIFLPIILSFISIIGFLHSPLFIQIREFFLTICYIMLVSLLWKNKYGRILSLILILLWVVNTSISIAIYQLFDSQLGYQLAITILSSNMSEYGDFLLSYWYVVLLSLILFFAMLFSAINLSGHVSTKILILFSTLLFLTASYKFCESAFRGRLSDPSFVMSEKVLPYTSLNNYGVFCRAYQEMQILNVAKSHRPHYQLTVKNSDIDLYVMVIGESVRRDHVSLYGYTQETSPRIEQERNNLFIFKQAVSPAPVTHMALASILTRKTAESTDLSILGDNIINLANLAGYKTYWFSKQGVIGQYETPVTGIAKSANVVQWIDRKYDDALLAKLTEALNDPDNPKKLIVLHTNGSHLSACNQYPKEEAILKNGLSDYENCYDNSILFMDKLVGHIFDKLRNKSAALLYFSDHGQLKRIKRGEVDYIHGAINPSKESVEIPQFIWFSPVVPKFAKKIGSYDKLYAAENNYFLIANWLGITKIDNIDITSPIYGDFKASDDVKVMDTRLNLFFYRNLSSDSVKHE